MLMQKQVDKQHYQFSRYMGIRRWASVWHQLAEVQNFKPNRVLEIGPGPGVFKAVASAFDVSVETLDIDPELKPDYVSSVFDMPFSDREFDVVCAFQVLEHMPYEQSLQAFREMVRVAKFGLVISLPDSKTLYPISFHLPKIGVINLAIPRPRLRPLVNKFDGEHYWEINKRGFPLRKVLEAFSAPGLELTRTFRVPQNPYHRFFIFTRNT